MPSIDRRLNYDVGGDGVNHNATVKDHGEDFVISGVSVRCPESDNIDEFAKNLFDGVDMVTADDRRWPEATFGLPTRNGKLKNVKYFDAAFFNVHPKQAHQMDPQLRLLLEVTYEAIVDSVNPSSIRGSRTGVFIGASGSDAQNAFSNDPETLEGYSMTGCATSMFANRLSYFFDFKGPSYTVDTACSSSLIALDCALNSLRTGGCDSAIIGGVNLCFRPQTSLQFLKLQMLSADGACRAFDSTGSGYVRSETVGIIYIQKRYDSKRFYATLLHSKTNTDGFKKEGITFPSGHVQQRLLEDIYKEINLDPRMIVYVEAHGTGDPQEMNSITNVFCNKRDGPLLIGSTKSNMGHPEPASGIAALAKLLISIQRGYIPGNLHFNSPNPDISGLTDGRLQVITEKTKLNGDFLAINSFGFGGSNAHAVLKANRNISYPKNDSRQEKRLATICARTEQGCETILNCLKENQHNIELQALLEEYSTHPPHTMPYRGFCLLNTSNPTVTIKKCLSERRPIYYIFSGMGTQWPGMGKELMKVKHFRQSIEKSSRVLEQYGIDLCKLIETGDEVEYDKTINNFVAIAAIQVALVDCLKQLGIQPDGIIGHSVGELGAMAAVGLSWDKCGEICPKDVVPACHNAKDTVTVSGPKESVDRFVEELKEKDIFARAVQTSGVAFHSHYMVKLAPLLKKYLETIITEPKKRSERWISSSVPEKRWNDELALYSSADYHVNNLCNPVLFQEALHHVPSNAITIELAPHCLLLAILKRSLSPDCTHINFMKKGNNHDHIDYFYTNIGEYFNFFKY
ncbi:unnamed protein product [Didymodactylos carnosus]|uniref:Fatty acid synthase n=1 Tax=Didymodactylos carnosus TaxID=1234261 RepID=A0A8S2S6P5_9BILA|nr:unnamed protein product [Didymodactylos carnosus]CAF4212429.1 unnamed protein product [Didymodactylos carnosus]